MAERLSQDLVRYPTTSVAPVDSTTTPSPLPTTQPGQYILLIGPDGVQYKFDPVNAVQEANRIWGAGNWTLPGARKNRLPQMYKSGDSMTMTPPPSPTVTPPNPLPGPVQNPNPDEGGLQTFPTAQVDQPSQKLFRAPMRAPAAQASPAAMGSAMKAFGMPSMKVPESGITTIPGSINAFKTPKFGKTYKI